MVGGTITMLTVGISNMWEHRTNTTAYNIGAQHGNYKAVRRTRDRNNSTHHSEFMKAVQVRSFPYGKYHGEQYLRPSMRIRLDSDDNSHPYHT